MRPRMVPPSMNQGCPRRDRPSSQEHTKEVTGKATWFCAGVGGKDAPVKRTGKYSPRPARNHVARPARNHVAYPSFGFVETSLSAKQS
jgi:hypothetical protein